MKNKENMNIAELLAIAREVQGVNYVKGDRILSSKRYIKETTHMIEFIVQKDDIQLGKCGEYHRRFLTEQDFRKALRWEKEQKIRIQKYARVEGRSLAYLSVFHSGGPKL